MRFSVLIEIIRQMQKQERIGIDVGNEVYFAYVVCHEFVSEARGGTLNVGSDRYARRKFFLENPKNTQILILNP